MPPHNFNRRLNGEEKLAQMGKPSHQRKTLCLSHMLQMNTHANIARDTCLHPSLTTLLSRKDLTATEPPFPLKKGQGL